MKKKKYFWYIIIGILTLLTAFTILFGQYTDRIADPFVRSLLEETKPMGHNIKYDKIRVNLFSGFILVENVKMVPEDSLNENKVRYNIDVATVKLTDVKLRELFFNKSLIVQDILIDDPNVFITLPLKTEDAINVVKERQTPKTKKQLLTNIFLERIIISKGDFKLFRGESLLASTTDLNFLAEAINLKKNSLEEPIGYTFGEVILSLKNIDLFSESGLYDMKLELLEARKKDSTVVMEGLQIIPKYSKTEFSKKIKLQNDRFDLKVGRIKIADVGLERWLNGEPLRIAKLQIENLDADIYRDKNVRANPDLFPLFYNESFLKLKIPLTIDTLSITNSKVLYGELSIESKKAGTIILNDFNLQSYNITNQVSADDSKNYMNLLVQAKIMGEGKMDIELKLPLEGNIREFVCSGSVGMMKLQPINSMLEPAIKMTFNGGILNRMAFNFTANDYESNGWMEFLFSDLDVALLREDADKQKKGLSLMANAVAISNNPAEGKDIKVVEIGFERDKNKGIINYIYKTLQSGMVRTIIPSNKYRIKSDKKEKTMNSKKNDKKKTKKSK